MPVLGYALSSEEHEPDTLVENARRAEDVGFEFALVSDHYHPWIDRQGESPFVWSVVGGVAEATDALRLGTGVTCPTVRIHPAVLAQAAATAEAMMPNRFFFGVGTGENLNEHVLGDHWPPHHVRLEMLEEALEVVRKLWTGRQTNHRGKHYTVENAQIYTLSDDPPPIHVAASGERAAQAAGRIGDGFVGTSPDEDVLAAFDDAGGAGKPRYGQLTVCYADDEDDALDTAYEWWPNTALPGELGQVLPTPTHFEQAVEVVTREDIAEAIVYGPDAQPYVDAIQEYADAGYDHVYLHQIGPDQNAFFEFFERELRPAFS